VLFRRELPAWPFKISATTRSFDCAAVRAANGGFAQDDIRLRVVEERKKYWLYIVCSRSGTLYIGMCNNIERRMAEHKSGEFEGFASKYCCNRLVYFESFDDMRNAIDREKQLKGWRREKKIALIESMNPRWADLAEKWAAQMLFANQRISDNEPSS